MNYYLFDSGDKTNFFPISATRSVWDIRIGGETFFSRFKKLISDKDQITLFVRKDLEQISKEKHKGFDINPSSISDGVWCAGHIFWTKDLLDKMLSKSNSKWFSDNELVGYNLSSAMGKSMIENGGPANSEANKNILIKDMECDKAHYLWEILNRVPKTLSEEVTNLVPNHNNLVNKNSIYMFGKDKIYISKTANIEPLTVLNAENGPIIIKDNVQIKSFTYIEGPVYIGSNSIVKPHSQISSSAIGPTCKIGGEIEHSIVQGYSNKVHDGHLGNAFLGEWVNIGAGTTNSNLKNTYSNVKVVIHENNIDTGQTSVGSFIGDFVRTGIGTQLNTGAVVGPCSNIVSTSISPKYFDSFSWYIDGKNDSYRISDFIKTAKNIKERRDKILSPAEISFFKELNQL